MIDDDKQAAKCWDTLNEFMRKFSSGGNSPTDITIAPTAALMTSACSFFSSTASVNGEVATAQREMQQLRFVAISKGNLSSDIAKATREYLNVMAYLQGCPDEVHSRYAEIGQRHFAQISLRAELDSSIILDNLRTQVEKAPLLARKCKWDS